MSTLKIATMKKRAAQGVAAAQFDLAMEILGKFMHKEQKHRSVVGLLQQAAMKGHKDAKEFLDLVSIVCTPRY